MKSLQKVINGVIRGEKNRELEIEVDRICFVVAEELIKARTAAGLTQLDIAKRINIKQQVVSKFESGESNLTLSSIVKYFFVCGYRVKINLVRK